MIDAVLMYAKDIIIEICTFAVYVGFAYAMRKQKSEYKINASQALLVGYVILFACGEAMYFSGVEGIWLHIALFFVCAGWAYCMEEFYEAVFTAFAIFGMCLCQIAMSVDYHVNGGGPTAIGGVWNVIITTIHLLIIIMTYLNGLTLHHGAGHRVSNRGQSL